MDQPPAEWIWLVYYFYISFFALLTPSASLQRQLQPGICDQIIQRKSH